MVNAESLKPHIDCFRCDCDSALLGGICFLAGEFETLIEPLLNCSC